MGLTVRMMLRRLRRRKLTLFLSSLILAWAMAMMVSGLFSSTVIEGSTSAYLEESAMPDAFVSLSAIRGEEEVRSLLSAPGLLAYDLRLRTGGALIGGGEAGTVTLIGIADPARQDIGRLDVLEGRLFSGPSEAVLIEGSGDVGPSLSVVVNGTVLDLTVTGTVRSPEHLLNGLGAAGLVPGAGGATIVVVPLRTVQAVLGEGINEIVVRTEGDGGEALALLSSLPISSVVLRADHPSIVYAGMGAGKMAVMMPSISVVFALVGGVSILITMYRMVQADSRHIGVLMSLGTDRRRIAGAYLVLAGAVIAAGGAAGTVLGYALTYALATLALDMLGGVPVTMSPDVWPFAIGLGIVSLITVLAVLFPVAMVLRRSIREALSSVPTMRSWAFHRRGGPLPAILGLRNFMREPRRTAAAVLIVALTVGAAGSWAVLLDSTQSYIGEEISANRWDVRIGLSAPMERSEAVKALTGEGVTDIVPYLEMGGLSSLDGRERGVRIIASPEVQRMRGFELRSGSLDLSGAVLAKKLADELGASPGDVLSLSVGGAAAELPVTAVVNDLQTNALYTANEEVVDLLGEGLCQGVWVSLSSPDLAAGYAEGARAVPQVATVEQREDLTASLRTTMEGAMGLFYAFFVLNLFIAFAVATSAVIISSSERDMDLATMTLLGLPRGFALRSLAVETGLLAATSASLAVPLAFILAQGFAALLEEAVFYVPVVLTAGAALLTATVGGLFVWASMVWPWRQSRRADVELILRERGGGWLRGRPALPRRAPSQSGQDRREKDAFR